MLWLGMHFTANAAVQISTFALVPVTGLFHDGLQDDEEKAVADSDDGSSGEENAPLRSILLRLDAVLSNLESCP
jgi:hypothetical protein